MEAVLGCLLLSVCSALGAVTPLKSPVYGGYLSLDTPHPDCKFIGQYLRHPYDECKFLRCDYGHEPWRDPYGNILFFAREMRCPDGLSVGYHYRYKGGYQSPCDTPSNTCFTYLEGYDPASYITSLLRKFFESFQNDYAPKEVPEVHKPKEEKPHKPEHLTYAPEPQTSEPEHRTYAPDPPTYVPERPTYETTHETYAPTYETTHQTYEPDPETYAPEPQTHAPETQTYPAEELTYPAEEQTYAPDTHKPEPQPHKLEPHPYEPVHYPNQPEPEYPSYEPHGWQKWLYYKK